MPNVQKGAVPSPSHSVARDVAQDVVRPPMAVRRLERYEGKRGTEQDRAHRTDRMEHATVDVAPCMGRLGQHTGAKGCQRLRSDGGPATQTFAKVKVRIHAA